MKKAIWNETVIAESDEMIELEGNHYFPKSALKLEFFQPSDKETTCWWKGVASYYDVVVDGQVNHDAAWYYADPKPAADEIRGRVAFWNGVEVVP